MNRSFWLSPQEAAYPSVKGRIKTDVAVVGGGLTGLCCALWLRRTGLEVALTEAGRLGDGSSARCAGVICLSNGMIFDDLEKKKGRKALESYAQTQMSAMRSIEKLAEESGIDWQETSVYLAGEEGSKLLEESEAMKRAGIQAELRSIDGQHVITLDGMAVVHPREYFHMLSQLALRAGVKIYENSRVVSLETNEVHTERGTIQAPYIVIATGYPIINVPGWYFLKIQQRKCTVAALSGQPSFDGVWMDANGRWMIRHLEDGALMQYSGEYAGSRKNDAEGREVLCRMTEQAGLRMNGECATGLECCTPDGLPYIGPYGGKTPNLFVASGYGGRGLIGSMVAAQTITARILGLPSEGYDIYSGQRSIESLKTPLAIGGRYLKELAVHPFAPHCPHMGCRLVYNPQSRIWECPCHGSRFDDIGHVLNAPAVHDAVLQNRKNIF